MTLHHGRAEDVLPTMEGGSVDALVTDPPAGISFMGRDWDHAHGGRDGWVRAFAAIFSECLRVLRPGAHGLVWALPRTSHWTATALEDAGFELRDCIVHIFGSGFPKSLDVSNAPDNYGDTGGASRFFYQAKPSPSERSAGLPPGMRSDHPTVKSIALMRWLCRLVTPPNGLILDPFAGSGSTGCAAVLEGFRFVGIEQDAHYCELARHRIAYWSQQPRLSLGVTA